MEYDFTRQSRDFGKIVLALTLDRRKMTERIVIGETNETRRLLERGEGEVYYDESRPLGQLLLTFGADSERMWSVNAMKLRESYGGIHPGRGVKWKTIKPYADFLSEKYETGEPSVMFAAIRTWQEYLNCYHLNHGPDRFIERTSLLYRPFFLYGEYKPWQEEATNALSQALHDGESAVELWYPVKKRPFECVVAFSSFQPVIFYYLHKIEDWGFVFQECKVCGKHFLARSRHFEVCGNKCRKVQAVEAKRQFDERAKGDRLEQVHESSYYYWYNRLRKLRKAKTAVPEGLAAIEAAFEVFRKETVRRKSMVKRGEMKLAEFTSWLADQQDEIDRLTEQHKQ